MGGWYPGLWGVRVRQSADECALFEPSANGVDADASLLTPGLGLCRTQPCDWSLQPILLSTSTRTRCF